MNNSSSEHAHNIERDIGLYIHIPFCRAKCLYCDFNSYAGMDNLIPAYFEALKKEIAIYGNTLKNNRIKTVFIGGGTPSYADASHICGVVEMCGECLCIDCGAEISIEANPGTLTSEKLEAYRSVGVNRLSMGLQAWQSSLLETLGRIHRADEFTNNYAHARNAGYDNIGVDLIFGIPGQSTGQWAQTLDELLELDPEHISCYSLTVEEDTVFGKMLAEGRLIPADDESDREMYHLAVERLKNRGYCHYEISNFSKPDRECRHNLNYWNAGRYIGIGAGAHSYFDGKRFNNCCGVHKYISSLGQNEIPAENIQEIDKKDEMAEYIILGLRLVEGIKPVEFERRFNKNMTVIYGARTDRLMKKGLIEYNGDSIRLTVRGLDLANQVFVEFI